MAKVKEAAFTPDEGADLQAFVEANAGKLTYKEKAELEGMERTILEAEQAAAALEVLLNDPNFHTAHATEAKETISKLESARAEIERLYARWEELSAL